MHKYKLNKDFLKNLENKIRQLIALEEKLKHEQNFWNTQKNATFSQFEAFSAELNVLDYQLYEMQKLLTDNQTESQLITKKIDSLKTDLNNLLKENDMKQFHSVISDKYVTYQNLKLVHNKEKYEQELVELDIAKNMADSDYADADEKLKYICDLFLDNSGQNNLDIVIQSVNLDKN